MKLNSNRSYDCKDEELPVVCGFGAISLARDLSDFTAYSPTFDLLYLATFKAKIAVVRELVQPLSETVKLKVITERIYLTLNNLISPANHLEGYLKLAGNQVPISSADFGLVQLRKSARLRDVENVLMQLQVVGGNINTYNNELVAKGLTEPLIAGFKEAARQLAEDKDKKYALLSNRKVTVQNNLGLLNDLYDQLTEICRVGKILYRQTDQAKLKDYTISQMMFQVKRSAKPVSQKTDFPAKS
jgi:hypothetical protein